jgi:hypothetical protein
LHGADGRNECCGGSCSRAKKYFEPGPFNLQTITAGEELMFIMDVPSVPVPQTPIVLAQATTPAAPQSDFILKACKETGSTGDTRYVMNGVDPAGMLAVYLGNRSNRDILSNSTALATIKTTLLEDAKHGKIIAGVRSYQYDPTEGYVGNDEVVFMAEFEGKRYKIIVELHVFDVAPMESQPTSCPPPQLIKVNGKPVSGSSGYDLNATANITALDGSSIAQTIIGISGITLNIADLPGGAVGQTVGTNITLDDNAAGNGWFIDTTPADNSEFLPTSNPNEWVAKAGSDAAGKMDMLSVLLHEYGHALGIEHSADSGDYMGTTLTVDVHQR